MNGSKRTFVAMGLLLTSWCHAEHVSATYDISTCGLPVGTMVVERHVLMHDGDPAVKMVRIADIQAGFLFLKYTMKTEETCLSDEIGLLEYDATFERNGKKTLIKAKLDQGLFRVSWQADSRTESKVLKKEEYEATTGEIIGGFLHEGEARHRVYDLEDKLTDTQTLTLVNWEKLNIAGHTFECRVIAFESERTRGRRWIADDDWGPFIVKEEGKEPGGPYAFKITSYEEKE